jgi:Flp pilus assembly protein TadB
MVFSVIVTVLLPARRRAVEQARRAERMVRDLPQVADLLASCLEAGAAPAAALEAVCAAVGGPLAEALRPVAVALRLGEDPDRVWSRAAADRAGPGAEVLPGPVRRLCRAVARASVTGAPLARTLSGLAEQERERLRWLAEAAARRAGVRAVGPLGACFLPAFLLLGVVPAVASVAGEVLTDLR